MILLDGKVASASVKENIKATVSAIISNNQRVPHLAAILIGNDGASETYVASKVRNCKEVGFQSTLIRFDNNVEEKVLLDKINELNNDDNIDGILVQLPLPKHIQEAKVIQAIHPDKDVDGFHPINAGKLVQGLPGIIPATPLGIMLLFEHYKIDTKGKNAIIIGRSYIVGRPMSVLLSSNLLYGNSTVTLCHSYTSNLKELCLQADIIVSAIGKPEFIKADMIKQNAIVIDVGITRVNDVTSVKGFKLKGDVLFNEVKEKASAITPVPGGVGLMTIAGLLKNTLAAYQKKMN
jgi:methylenetetrahydrofolate dehydrogenase (NADP+)/methenyltetrahydrofolate cyclohydrolase